MNLLGFVQRVTRDVDVIAIANPHQLTRLERPSHLAETLERAVATVARDLQLSPDWLNIVAAGQWDTGLPPGMETRLHWRQYDALWVGLVDRRDLIFFKLYAAPMMSDQAACIFRTCSRSSRPTPSWKPQLHGSGPRIHRLSFSPDFTK